MTVRNILAGQRFRSARIKAQLTLQELAVKLGYKQDTTLRILEQGLMPRKSDKLKRIAKALGVEFNWLLGVEKIKRPRDFTPTELARCGVTICDVSAGRAKLGCKKCSVAWFCKIKINGKLPREYWHCPNGCNNKTAN
jgi:transcriptional regulator with XRE-family HTH domain